MAFDFDRPPSDIRFPTNVARKARGMDVQGFKEEFASAFLFVRNMAWVSNLAFRKKIITHGLSRTNFGTENPNQFPRVPRRGFQALSTECCRNCLLHNFPKQIPKQH